MHAREYLAGSLSTGPAGNPQQGICRRLRRSRRNREDAPLARGRESVEPAGNPRDPEIIRAAVVAALKRSH